MADSQSFVRDIQRFAQDIVDTVREPLLILDTSLRVQSANRAFYRVFRVTPEETMGRPVYDLGDGPWDIPALGPRTMLLNARKVYPPDNHPELLLLAIEDITDYKSVLDKLSAEYEREHCIALALTRPLVMEIAENAFPSLSVATLYSSAWADQGETVGGDFYDGFALADGRVAFVLGDATGKGLGAAARAIEIKEVTRAFLRVYPYYPAQTLTRLNDYLCDTQSLDGRSNDHFMALALAVVNPRRSEIVCAWGGIEPPMILRANGEVEVVAGGGRPLGVSMHEVYAETTLQFHTGDVLVMNTDGLSEARSQRGGEFLGHEGVIALVKAAQAEPSLKAMSEAIIDGAKAFAGGQLQDDACLVLARKI